MANLLSSDNNAEGIGEARDQKPKGLKGRTPRRSLREGNKAWSSPNAKGKSLTNGARAKNKHGLTDQQDRFAQLVAVGMTGSDAYREAYNVSPDTKPTSVHVSASKLMSNPTVKLRLNSLRDRISNEDWQDMGKLRAVALKTLHSEALGLGDDTKSSARISAAVAIGKITEINLFTDHKVIEHRDDSRIDTLKAKLEQRLRTMFDKAQSSPVAALIGQSSTTETEE